MQGDSALAFPKTWAMAYSSPAQPVGRWVLVAGKSEMCSVGIHYF